MKMWLYEKELSAIMSRKVLSLNYASPNAPFCRGNAPFSQKAVYFCYLIDYGKTTNEDCELI